MNLAFSSLEEDARAQVLDRCYWPLLRLAAERDFPIGIEAPAYTLETAAQLDPDWMAMLRELVEAGRCEFIGSGYSQLIGPLVPAAVNAANLRLGHAVYESLLGRRPQIALVNEQAYSAGLIQHYLDAGYSALIMEWDNPALSHPDWNPEWRYFPQIACGQHGESIPLIWISSIAFQKFQRYAHGELQLSEYLSYVSNARGPTPRAFPVYGSDVETFDFRAGRFDSEAPVAADGEWKRIQKLAEALLADDRFRPVLPSSVLDLADSPLAGNRLQLEAAARPIPVKKQGKYNITRWAVTGRDDIEINTRCWRLYEQLKGFTAASDQDWRELCYLWSSDFRTHITDSRWTRYLQRLDLFERRVLTSPLETPRVTRAEIDGGAQRKATVTREGHLLTVLAGNARLVLNCRRGLAIDALTFGDYWPQPLCGTLPHGFYDDIRLAADFYSGHVVLETPGRAKLTDLSSVEPAIDYVNDTVEITGTIRTPLGDLQKQYRVLVGKNRVEIDYRLDWPTLPMGSLRLGYVTLNPLAFDKDSLFFRTSNGGKKSETFPLNRQSVDHGAAVSFLISAAEGIGVTDGVVVMGDARKSLRIEIDKSVAAVVGMVAHAETSRGYFSRLAFSASEVDETRRIGYDLVGSRRFSMALSGAAADV